MGTPMARHLLDDGHTVAVWNRTPQRAHELRDAGARAASTPAQAAADADVVFVCVTDGAAVEEVIFGAAGVATGAAPGTTIVDHSTIHPQQSRDFARRLAALGIGFIDAPVSGGPSGAQAGTLAVFLGGTPDDVARVRPLIASYAATVTHIGPAGAGQLAKSCNQAVVTATVAIWSEMIGYARANGLDPALVVEAVEGGWADSPIRRAFGPRLAAGALGNTGALWIKDLGIVADVAAHARAAIPVTAVVTEQLRKLFEA